MTPQEAKEQVQCMLSPSLPSVTTGQWGEIARKIDCSEKGIAEIWPGFSLFQGFAEAGHKLACLKLVEKGVDVNAVLDNTGLTILMHAAKHKNVAMMNTLLELGADVNAQDKLGETALMKTGGSEAGMRRASYFMSIDTLTECVDALLGAGADLNARCSSGATALRKAIEFGHEQLAQVLLNCGAEIEAISTYRMTGSNTSNAYMLELLAMYSGTPAQQTNRRLVRRPASTRRRGILGTLLQEF